MSFSELIAHKGINSPWEDLIKSASVRHGIEIALIKAIISQESAWDPNAVNPNDPSYGLMQLNFHYFKTSSGEPILDPAENIDRGTAYLAEQMNRFGPDLSAVISSYNAGHPISGNAPYVNSVLQYRSWFLGNDIQISNGDDGGTGSGGTDFPNQKDLVWIVGAVIGGLLLYSVLSR